MSVLDQHVCRSEQRALPAPTGAIDRRRFLWHWGGGLGGIALAHLLGRSNQLAATPAPGPELNGGLHHRAKAKRVVQLFMSGAASQVDTFDYKPLLLKRNGEKFDPGGKVELFQSEPGPVMQSPREWKQYGESGKWMSSLVPNLGTCVDDMAFFHSMVSKSNVHGPATFMQNTGFILPGYPSVGAWISYGLGSMNENLPTFVVLPDPRGFAPNGPANHSGAFLPALHQGTMIRVGRPNPIHDLFPPKSAKYINEQSEADGLALQGGGRSYLLLRPTRHRPAPDGHRPQAPYLPPQRHRPPPNRRAWAGHRRSSGLGSSLSLQGSVRSNAGRCIIATSANSSTSSTLGSRSGGTRPHTMGVRTE